MNRSELYANTLLQDNKIVANIYYNEYFSWQDNNLSNASLVCGADSIASHVESEVVHVVIDVGDVPLVRAVRIFITGASVHHVRLVLVPLACRERQKNKNTCECNEILGVSK